MTLYIRLEQPEDVDAITSVVAQAFSSGQEGGQPEVNLVNRLRNDHEAWLPRLSLVAVLDGQVVGSVMGSRVSVDGSSAVALAPLAVLPQHQGQGIGEQLVRRFIGEARSAGEGLILVLGDPKYYSRFGFRAAADTGIVGPYVGEAFQALTLAADAPVGRAVYPAAFAGV
jgi:putative acetyltransferase